MISQAYQQVYRTLRGQILDQYYAVGQKLPAERELCEQYGVSRITTRHALRLLVEEGFLERHPGRGTFVRAAQAKKIPILDADFTRSMQSAVPGLTRRLLGLAQEIELPKGVCDKLGLSEPEHYFFAERLDLLDNEPLAFDRIYLPFEYSNGITQAMLECVDFFDRWCRTEGVSVSHSKQMIEAIAADEQVVKRLGVPEKSPILLVTDMIYFTNDTIAVLFETLYRGDRYQLNSTSLAGLNYGDTSS